ncbi:MAG: acylneuraminate cytidylyltransferase family protein [Nanoarchaeota archaeon]
MKLSNKNNIIAIMGARSGSKGIPGKNLKSMNGKSLISYSIEAGKLSKYITKVVVGTDDKKIAKICNKLGADVVMLPIELTTDTSPMEPMLKYVLETYEKNQKINVDIVVYFQLTDFFKKPEWIDECIECLLNNNEIDSCFIGCEEHKNYWKKQGKRYIKLTNASYTPRQQRKPIFREDTGLGTATRADNIRNGKRLGKNTILLEKKYPFFDIHDELDFAILEFVARNYPNIAKDYYKDYKKNNL